MVIFISNLINNPKYDYLACFKDIENSKLRRQRKKNISFYYKIIPCTIMITTGLILYNVLIIVQGIIVL